MKNLCKDLLCLKMNYYVHKLLCVFYFHLDGFSFFVFFLCLVDPSCINKRLFQQDVVISVSVTCTGRGSIEVQELRCDYNYVCLSLRSTHQITQWLCSYFMSCLSHETSSTTDLFLTNHRSRHKSGNCKLVVASTPEQQVGL